MGETKKWIPKKGELIVRAHVTAASTEFDFCYRDADDEGESHQHYRGICRIRYFSAEPNFSTFVECIHGSAGITGMIGSEGVVHRHYLTREELYAIKQLWADKRNPFEEWLHNVLALDGLADDEKDRLRKAFL